MLSSAPGPRHDDPVPMPDATASPDQPPRVLVIDDDRKLCRLIADYLDPLGYRVSYVHSGPEGVARATQEPWGAVILDLMLPGLDGFEVLKRIRAASDVPVLMLTARGDEADRIVGLEIGADDYLPKTFSTRELLARLRAVMRRARRPAAAPAGHHGGSAAADGPAALKIISVGDLAVCPDNRTATLAGAPLALTPVEFDLLLSLARACGRVKSREQLVDEIRDRDYDVFDRSVDVHISALRKKLGDDPRQPRFIQTLRSAGYLMIDPRRRR
jgi:DNA-binding response OmpR family regulator